mmetsp:Transcript_88878/g.287471  ORF Transcript_88878/g.287471 Transcript_88878/m.287471 type:complete len:349 (-) Transcript_88878:1366-2412(-)
MWLILTLSGFDDFRRFADAPAAGMDSKSRYAHTAPMADPSCREAPCKANRSAAARGLAGLCLANCCATSSLVTADMPSGSIATPTHTPGSSSTHSATRLADRSGVGDLRSLHPIARVTCTASSASAGVHSTVPRTTVSSASFSACRARSTSFGHAFCSRASGAWNFFSTACFVCLGPQPSRTPISFAATAGSAANRPPSTAASICASNSAATWSIPNMDSMAEAAASSLEKAPMARALSSSPTLSGCTTKESLRKTFRMEVFPSLRSFDPKPSVANGLEARAICTNNLSFSLAMACNSAGRALTDERCRLPGAPSAKRQPADSMRNSSSWHAIVCASPPTTNWDVHGA